MASPTQGTQVWVNSGCWWWTGRPGVLQSMGSQKNQTRLSDWNELNWKSGLAGLLKSLLDSEKLSCQHARLSWGRTRQIYLLASAILLYVVCFSGSIWCLCFSYSCALHSWFHYLKWSPIVMLKCCLLFFKTRRLWYTISGKYTLHKLHSSISCSSVGCELNVNESKICIIVVFQLLSHVRLFANPWTAAHQASLSFTLSQFAQTHIHWVSDAVQPSHPLSPSSPLALHLSQHQGLLTICII